MSTANPYAVLGVPEDASSQDIKKAYRRQMRLAAVDTHPDVSDAEREVLLQRMVEVNRAYETLGGAGREVFDAELRRQRAAEADREAALERERLYRVRRQEAERARRAARGQRDAERRHQEAAWVREYVDEGPGYRYEVRMEGPVVTQEVLDALWALLAPQPGQDVHETVEVTRGQWASGAAWRSGVDGLPLPGLEHADPATYRFAGRGGPGAHGGPRGDLYVTVVHVGDLGQPVAGGFRAARRSEPAGGTATRRPAQGATPRRSRGPVAAVAAAFGLLRTVLTWALIAMAVLVGVAVVVAVVLVLLAALD